MNITKYNEICNFLKNILKNTKFENHIYTVGGCVRDSILGIEIKDIDLVVDLPNGGIQLAEWLYQHNYLAHTPIIFETYGTAKLMFRQFPTIELEVVQTRKEQYKDRNSRNPETTFGTLEEDCYRRDLTINSLYYDITNNNIIDITNTAINDIKNCIIRTPSNPNIIFDDDALRILRVIRFASRLNWEIEEMTYKALINNVKRLEIISKERIANELNAMLLNKNAMKALELLFNTKALEYVIPELMQLQTLKQGKQHFGTVWEHTLATVDKLSNCNDLVVKMAALLHDIGKSQCQTIENNKIHFYSHENYSVLMAKTILTRLRYSNNFIKDVCFLIQNHMRTKSFGDECKNMKDKHIRQLQFDCGYKYFDRLMLLIDADNKSHADNYCMRNQASIIIQKSNELVDKHEDMFEFKFPINGNDIIQLFNNNISPTKIKTYLNIVKHIYFANPFLNKNSCLKQLKNSKIKN